MSWDNKGYSPESAISYRDKLEVSYKDKFGENGLDLTPQSVDGAKISVDSEMMAVLSDSLHGAVVSKDPRQASGVQLDIICSLNNITRHQGTRSRCDVTLTGTPNLFVKKGLAMLDANGIGWTTLNDVTLDATTGQASTPSECDEVGSISAAAGEINTINDSVNGLESVTNPTAAANGEDAESDTALRRRRSLAVSQVSKSQTEALLSGIHSIEGVSQAYVYDQDNSTSITIDGVIYQPNSVYVFVEGGDDNEIAEVMYAYKNSGIPYMPITGQSVSVDVQDRNFPNNVKTIVFNRPEYVDIYIHIAIAEISYLTPEDIDRIKEYVYIFATGGDIQGASSPARGMGVDVVASSYSWAVNAAINEGGKNTYVDWIKVGDSESTAEDYNRISVSNTQLAFFNKDWIEVS